MYNVSYTSVENSLGILGEKAKRNRHDKENLKAGMVVKMDSLRFT